MSFNELETRKGVQKIGVVKSGPGEALANRAGRSYFISRNIGRQKTLVRVLVNDRSKVALLHKRKEQSSASFTTEINYCVAAFL